MSATADATRAMVRTSLNSRLIHLNSLPYLRCVDYMNVSKKQHLDNIFNERYVYIAV